MNKKGEICIGMAGAGRATELHMNALKRLGGLRICNKHIIARRSEQVNAAKVQHDFRRASTNFEDLLNDSEIDVIDICTPPYVHEKMILDALKAGKHVICEKPLSGYFGVEGENGNIGNRISKVEMFDELIKSLEKIRTAVEYSDRKIMYAENFIYAPAVRKAAEILEKKKSKILFAKGEESLKGSSSRVAGEWNRTGGGTFLRTGAHPLSAILWLKQIEAKVRGEKISVESVLGDTSRMTPQLNEHEHRHIAARPQDVEDFGLAILTFSDNTKAVIMATDTLLGGSKNYVQLYCNDSVINCKLTMSDLMETYFLDNEGIENLYLSEMLPSNLGWNKVALDDEIIRGYADEMKDFMECIYFDREPQSGFTMAYDTIKIIYAVYKSAEIGRSVSV